MVKRRDLVKEVEAQGLRNCGGASHDIFKKPGFTTSIPRHREIDENRGFGSLCDKGLA